MFRHVLLLCLLLCQTNLVAARPNGAPVCSITMSQMTNAHGSPQTGVAPLRFSLNMTRVNNDYTINLLGSDTFRGVLLWASAPGRFMNVAPDYQTICNGTSLTHRSNNNKKSTQFLFRTNAVQTQFTMNVVVVGSGVKLYQFLNVTMTKTNAAPTRATGNPPSLAAPSNKAPTPLIKPTPLVKTKSSSVTLTAFRSLSSISVALVSMLLTQNL